MGISLGVNQYGKAEVRMVHVDRSGPRHRITDVTVTSQLRGDFSATHETGDNSAVIATDTQKNTVYALARLGGVGAVEDFALRVARHFVDGFEQVTGARQEVEEHGWERIVTSEAGEHDHAFSRGSGETRTTVVTKTGAEEIVISGVSGLVVLKSTGSEFHGFPDVPYTSLVETDDRILATAVTARWRYLGVDVDWDKAHGSVRQILLDRFALTHSLSLQQTLYAMGRGVLEAHPEIAEIRFSMPNKHHFLVDLSTWGLDNPNEVWYAADRPYGLIEAAVVQDDVPPADAAWAGIAGFV
ncbi:factor-independent urate hydroxylase [Pseudonocardia abyssalis]|uniref:Uricase n=1 Tax=Pseudonocardia abyssalis TaxID=2792008 RepID=A0ABS6UZ20_9PSEU|nr:urate oxidase [Pseudonocardia abyssalis]MBW0118094.1 urate oxidase [Pseudonocardia abyssalis]MBW0137475.1 urate oxidase [Pseudonocardia abyssalis]